MMVAHHLKSNHWRRKQYKMELKSGMQITFYDRFFLMIANSVRLWWFVRGYWLVLFCLKFCSLWTCTLNFCREQAYCREVMAGLRSVAVVKVQAYCCKKLLVNIFCDV